MFKFQYLYIFQRSFLTSRFLFPYLNSKFQYPKFTLTHLGTKFRYPYLDSEFPYLCLRFSSFNICIKGFAT